MDAGKLLRTVDPLPHAERMARLAAVARRLPAPELRRLLDELGSGDTFRRRLGLHVAAVAREPGYVRTRLTDPEPAVQGPAVVVALRLPEVPDDVFAALYEDASAWLRGRLVRAVRDGGRHGLAGRLIETARRRWGEQEAVRLLPACAGGELRRHLHDLAHLLTAGQWSRLGRLRPDAVLDHAESVLPELPAGDAADRWWKTAGWGVAAAAVERPERVLGLVLHRLPSDLFPASVRSVLGRLLRVDATAVVGLLVEPDRRREVLAGAFGTRMLRRLNALPDAGLGTVGRVLWARPHRFARFLRALPPARRGTVFTLTTARLDLSQVVLADDVLDALPHADRRVHAARMLALRPVRDVDEERWRVSAHLPFDDAFPGLAEAVARPDAGERAAVYRAVVACAGRSREPAVVARVVGWLSRIRNEQDPVRRVVLEAVAGLPPSLLEGAHTGALGVLVKDAMEARDRSWATEQALASLASSAVVQGAVRQDQTLLQWGFATHRYVSGVSGTLTLGGLCDGVPRGREHALYDAFLPHVDAAMRRGSYWLPLTVASGFGKRGWDIEPLYRAVERALRSTESFMVTWAVELWLADHRHRDERVGRLFGGFPRRRMLRFARSNAVWRAVSEHRTDLLDRVFSDPRPTLRFRDLGAWDVRPSALYRWLPRQHLAYARLLRHVANDHHQPRYTKAAAVRTLGRVPELGRGALGPYLGSPDTVIREAALAALAWTDRPDEVLPDLLSTAGSEDARVGMYASARAARFVRPSGLTAVLGPVLADAGSKITSQKEAARLLGELHATDAVERFHAAWPDAHRDVRAAMVAVTAQHLLDQPGAWRLLRSALDDAAAVAEAVVRVSPYTVAVRHRERYGELIVSACAHDDRDVIHASLRALAAWADWAPGGMPMCTGAVVDLARPAGVWRTAVKALGQYARARVGVPEIAETVRSLVRTDHDPAGPDAADRDRPARQRLAVLVAELTARSRSQVAGWRGTLRTIAAALAEEPAHLGTWARLQIAALDWQAPGPDLDELMGRLSVRPVQAVHAAAVLTDTMQATQAHWTSDAFEPLVPRLAGHSCAGGLLAVAIVRQCGGRREWPAPWRERLRELRAHPDDDVREAALAVFTTGE